MLAKIKRGGFWEYLVNTKYWKKDDLVLAMWRNGYPAAAFVNGGVQPPGEPSIKEINEYFRHDSHIDYLNGRALKTSFGMWPIIVSSKYDRYCTEEGRPTLEHVLENEWINYDYRKKTKETEETEEIIIKYAK